MTVRLIAERAAERLVSTYGGDTPDTGVIHVPGGTELNGAGFHHATQDGAPCNTYELFLEFSIEKFWIVTERG